MADARVPDEFIVAPSFRNKTRYTPYVSLGSQICNTLGVKHALSLIKAMHKHSHQA